MSLLVFAVFVLIAVGIVCAIAYYIPWPPPIVWMRWVIPCVVLLIALIVLAQKMGVV